jgi:cell division septation protein DedD
MPRNDDGEFELILGNKQLLSVFFIVIILLGVFFTMGYIVGRNSGPGDTAKKNGAGDAVTPARTDAQSSMPAATTPTPTVVEPVTREPITREPVTPTPAPVAETPKPAPAKAPIEVTAVNSSVTEPIPGQIYIQVLAVARPEAEVLADVLAKKGFRSMVAPGPNDKIFRVLVGPAKDASDAGKLKGDLEQAGFKLAFPKKF